MNYVEACHYLDSVRDQGAKLALDNIQNLIDHLPFDLSTIRFIQIAGTNGKGSTSHFTASILRAAGERTGLFTSPHLQTIRERIMVNGEEISPAEFGISMTAIRDISRDLVDRGTIAHLPTYFEHVFLTALHYFHTRKVTAAVMEVGLGGRLDATTSLTPVVTAITNISYDHTKTLGSSLSEIAREKAGIIKPGIPLVCGCPPRTVSKRVIESICHERGAPFQQVTRSRDDLEVKPAEPGYECTYHSREKTRHFFVRMNGIHQARNAATAIRVAESFFSESRFLEDSAVAQGISSTRVPGRIEHIESTPPILIDGGHNEAGTMALSRFLLERDLRNLTLIFGVLRDKKYRRMVSLLRPYISRVIVTEPVSNRALPAEKTVRCFPASLSPTIQRDYPKALQAARAVGQPVLITGSLYMAGTMRSLILGEKP